MFLLFLVVVVVVSHEKKKNSSSEVSVRSRWENMDCIAVMVIWDLQPQFQLHMGFREEDKVRLPEKDTQQLEE